MPVAQDILITLQGSPTALTLSELLARHSDVSRRSAQRWLKQWEQEGKVTALGRGPARRYIAVEWTETPASLSPSPVGMPLSPASRDVLAYVRQPLQARNPVGYQRDFLESYQPNHTEYLSQFLRSRLHKIGDTGGAGLPAGTHGRAILNRLLIDLSWASSHLEGNTYTRLDTRELIEHGKAAPGKDAKETQMILNHKTAIELIMDDMDAAGFNRYTLFNVHAALAENLLPNPADEGRIRQHAVEISQSVYRPLALRAQLDELLDLILKKGAKINDPFEQSFFAMVHLPYLQPFADVNKRTSRLIANIPLLRANLCPLTFLGVSEDTYSSVMLGIYEANRIEPLRDLFVWAYERSTQEYVALKQVLAEPDPLRLMYRHVIKEIVREVVRRPNEDPVAVVNQKVDEQITQQKDRPQVKALIDDELRRLHDGVLGRYNLRPAELAAWRQGQAKPFDAF